jgi:hypothetical protein
MSSESGVRTSESSPKEGEDGDVGEGSKIVLVRFWLPLEEGKVSEDLFAFLLRIGRGWGASCEGGGSEFPPTSFLESDFLYHQNLVPR